MLFEPQRAHLHDYYGFAHYYLYQGDYGSTYEGDSLMVALQQEANINSWKYHLGQGVSAADIQEILYSKELTESDLRDFNTFAARSTSSQLQANGLVKLWLAGRNLDDLAYMAFAKECEPYARRHSPWDDEPATAKPIIVATIDRAKSAYSKTQDAFLKLRYAYQILRLTQYHLNPKDGIAEYQRYALPVLGASKEIGAWVTGNYAGCLMHEKRYAAASYAFSRLYADAPSRREQARQGWKIPNAKSWNQLMQLCKNDREKADNYALRALGFNSIPFEDMRMMQKLDPGRPDLDMLLVREVNKIESEMLGYIGDLERPRARVLQDVRYKPKTRKRLHQLDEVIADVQATGAQADSALWQLAHIYLQFLDGQFEQAISELNALIPSLHGEDLVRAQMMDLEIELTTADRITPVMERRYSRAYITQKSHWEEPEIYQFIAFRNDVLFSKYLAQGDELKATLVQEPSMILVRYGIRVSLLDSLFALIDNPNKSDFEAELVADLLAEMDRDALLDVKGTALLTQSKLDEAIATYRQISESYRQKSSNFQLLSDPFRPRIRQINEKNWFWENKEYNKLTFAETLRALMHAQEHLHDGMLAHRWLIIGDAYYNTLSQQRNWDAFSNSDYWGFEPGFHSAFYKSYNIAGHRFKAWPRNVDAAPAMRYFDRAIAETQNRDLQALAYFMKAQCERHNADMMARHDIPVRSEDRMPSFAILKSQFLDTQVADRLIQECPNFAKYCAD